MGAMIRLLRALFAAPDAERDPAAWATRLFAHMGVGLIGWLFFTLPLGPWGAVAAVAVLYCIWETGQWPGGRRMAWDAVLDWCAVALAASAAASAWEQVGWAAAGAAVAALAIAAAGVWRRA